MRNKNQRGFTLIELLVVIAIIGLLASVVLLALNSARSKARDAKRMADVRQIATAMEMYYNDNPTVGYPTTTAALVPGYIGSWPTPVTPKDVADASCTTVQNAYDFQRAQNNYTISFCIGSQAGGYAAGLHYMTEGGIK